MKHVSESTWERLKDEAAADLYNELHREPPADAPDDREDHSDAESADD